MNRNPHGITITTSKHIFLYSTDSSGTNICLVGPRAFAVSPMFGKTAGRTKDLDVNNMCMNKRVATVNMHKANRTARLCAISGAASNTD